MMEANRRHPHYAEVPAGSASHPATILFSGLRQSSKTAEKVRCTLRASPPRPGLPGHSPRVDNIGAGSLHFRDGLLEWGPRSFIHRMPKGKVIIGPTAVNRVLERMAHEMAERHETGQDIVLVGVQTGGVYLTRRLAAILGQIWGQPVPCGVLDVGMHRDDLERGTEVRVHETSLPFDLNRKIVVLVDDVLSTGRTTRAALDALHDYGRPKAVELAVLIDRGRRQLPVKADFVGKTVSVGPDERVVVLVTDGRRPDCVSVEKT